MPLRVSICTMPGASMKRYGKRRASARSARPRPIRRLTDTIVFCGSATCASCGGVADVDAVSAHSARSTAAAVGPPRRAARPGCRCARSRPASSSCRGRCRPRADFDAEPARAPVRRSAAAPSAFDLADQPPRCRAATLVRNAIRAPASRALSHACRRRARSAKHGLQHGRRPTAPRAAARQGGPHRAQPAPRRPPPAARARARRNSAGSAVFVSASASIPRNDSRYCARPTGSFSARYASLTRAEDCRATRRSASPAAA